MAINRFQNSDPYNLFTQALGGLPFQTSQKPPQGPLPQTAPVNPFQTAELGGGSAPLDQFGLFQNLLSTGLLQPNLGQPPIPPEGMGRRFLATA